MYAVIETGGKQYKIQEGDKLRVEKLDAKVGDTVTFDKVLFIGGDDVKVGRPYVEGAKVQAKVLEQNKAKKEPLSSSSISKSNIFSKTL